MSTALAIPVRDPLSAARALAEAWVMPLLGNVTRRVASWVVGPIVRGTFAILGATSAEEAERMLVSLDSRNMRNATLGFLPLAAWAKAIPRKPLPESIEELARFFAWWESESEKSAAPPELRSQVDVALYSMIRALRQWSEFDVRVKRGEAAAPSIPQRPWHGPRIIARVLTGTQVGVAAVLGVLAIGRDLPIRVNEGALEVIVRRFASDVDAVTRWMAKITAE